MILQQCHLGVTLCLVVFLLKPEIISCEAESKTISAEDLPVEHRGAKPEPFLDFVYDLFGGNKKTNKKNADKKAQHKPGPVFVQQKPSPSFQRPVAIRPPSPPRPPRRPALPPPPPQRFPSQPQTQPSNNFQTFVNPGKVHILSVFEAREPRKMLLS